jgi:hypothetical protein
MEKWIVTTSAVVALSTALVAFSTQGSLVASQSGASRRLVIGVEQGKSAVIQGAEIQPGYWADLAGEVKTWPRFSTEHPIQDDDGPEPLA